MATALLPSMEFKNAHNSTKNTTTTNSSSKLSINVDSRRSHDVEPLSPYEQQQQGRANDSVHEKSEQSPPANQELPYSAFSHRQKKVIIIAASIAALMSPLSSQIYLPAVEEIAKEFKQSNNRINLTITSFLIMQGIAPTFVAAFSDELGRRPAYLICFPIYIAANIGLALQRSYGALLALRCLQSTGSSGTVTLSNAIVADMVTSSERGIYIGFAQIGTILGPAIGPILGGIISQYAGWRWIFWFLTIISSAIFLPLLLFLPETCRKIAGDGHQNAHAPLFAPIADLCHGLRGQKKKPEADQKPNEREQQPQRKRSLNPLASLVIMLDTETALLLFCNGFAIACFIGVTTSIPSQFQQIYSYNQLLTSLIYLPISAGSLVSAFSTGKLIDRNYKRHAIRLGHPLTRNRQSDLTNFPIEKARLEIALPLMYLASISLILYGWILHLETHVAGPIFLLFLFGYAIVAAYQVTAILLVDIHPGRPATATAANNLVRCSLSAAASAAVNPMLEAMGRGWTFTTLSLVWVVLSPCFWVLMARGPRWRREKKEKEEQNEKGVEEQKDKHTVSNNGILVERETSRNFVVERN